MCGINGIFGSDRNNDFSLLVKKMNDRLAHRGPDDDGVFSEAGICIGHRRLSIIDLSAAGHQPMTSDDGNLVVVFNGEIYNYREVKSALPDYPFRTATDTEVLIAAWKEWGVKCLDRLNGMFGFALWDKARGTLYIVRDRMGIKPVYYYQKDEIFTFSSELRALMASGLFERKIDLQSLEEYIRYQTVFAPRTIINGVRMLKPGHLLVADRSGVTEKQWWKPDVKPSEISHNYTEVCAEVKKLFTNAVQQRLVADVPFGAFLSGGIDSAAVTGMMSRISNSPVKTFNVTFDESEFSESVYARLIAGRFKTDHHEIVLRPDDFLNCIPHALSAMDHPSGDGPNTFIVSQATRKAGITMALSGLGGDELFCGYDIFRRAYSLQSRKWLNSVPAGLRKAAGAFYKTLKPGIASAKIADVLSLQNISFDATYPKSREVLGDEIISGLLSVKTNWIFPDSDSIYGAIEFPSDTHFLSRVSLAEITTYMQNTLLRDADQMSMAHALEVRVPFLDYKLVNYVLSVSDSMKYPVSPKKLLVDSLGDLLPAEVVNRPKMGFTLPWKNWMKNELRSFCLENLRNLEKCDGINVNAAVKLMERFLNGDPQITWSRVWHLVVLGYWIKENEVGK